MTVNKRLDMTSHIIFIMFIPVIFDIFDVFDIMNIIILRFAEIATSQHLRG